MRPAKRGGRHAAGDIAFCRSCNHISGAWKLVHEHASVPFYMDGSYRAAVDLQP